MLKVISYLRNIIYNNKSDILIILFLFLLTFSSRAYRLSETPIYPDEITWMVRAKEASLAVRTQRLEYFKTAWWNIKDDTEAIAIPLTLSAGFPIIYLARDASVLSFNLFQDYIIGRYSVIIITSVFVSVLYIFLRKILNKKTAFLAAFLLSLDPIFMANSKIIMNDIYLTIFLFLSLAAYLIIENVSISVFMASVCFAFAFLTKPNALVILPVFGLQILINRQSFLVETKKFLITILLSFVIISICWPNSWNNPLFAIPEYLFRQTSLVQNGINNFFFGQITNNPPFYYYIFQILIKIPPVILLGFTAFFILLFKKRYRQKTNIKFFISALFFIFLFVIAISFSAKKLGARYALPLWPWIYVISIETIYYFLLKIKNRILEIVFIVGVLILSIGNYLRLFPYNDLYYNFLIGGAKNAVKYDLVGLCSGSKATVDYISKCYPDVKVIGALGCGRSTIPYYYPNTFDYNWKKDNVWFVEAYYLQLNKDQEVTDFFRKNKPTHTIDINGINLAYIYTKRDIKDNCVQQ